MTAGAPDPGERFEIVDVSGGADETDLAAIRTAIAKALEADRRTRSSSVWLRSARAQGRRLGMYDYRDRFSSGDAWRLSVRFPPGGREYPGLVGRGDAR